MLAKSWYRLEATRPYLGVLLMSMLACAPRDQAAAKAESIRRGDQFVEKKQYAQAASAYGAAVKLDPNDGRLRMKLANAHELSGSGARASDEAVVAAELLPGDLDVQVRTAGLMLRQRRFLEVVSRMAAILRDHPDNADAIVLWGNGTARLINSTWALYRLADAVHDKDKYDAARHNLRQSTTAEEDAAAEEAFRTALRLAPTKLEAQLALINFLWATGRPDEGEALLKRVADQIPRHASVNRALGEFYLSRHRDFDGERYLKNAAATGSYGAGARFSLADYYIGASRDQDALSLLDSMMASDDASGGVSVRTAEIEFRLGRQDDAIRRLDTLLKREPRHSRGLLLKARFLFTMRNLDQALTLARAAVAADPNSSDARLTLGRALSAKGDPDGAFEQFTEMVRLDPSATQGGMELVRLALALGRDQVALQFAREAVSRHPDDRDAAVAMVKALVRLRDYSTADQALKPMLTRYPASPDLLVQLGAIQAARGNGVAASATYERALQLEPDSLDALSGIVSLDLEARHITTARQRIRQALATHPNDPGYLLLAGRVFSAENDIAGAEATFRRVLDIDHANISAALLLSGLLAAHSGANEARRVLEQFLEHRPSSVDARTSLAVLLERMGRTTEARVQYEMIIGGNPRAATAAHRLARLYVDQGGDLNVALSLAVTAKQQLPNDPAVSDTIGWVYVRKNLPALGLPHLEDSVRAVPANPTYRYHLGAAYLAAGQLQRARDELTRALLLGQDSPHANEARAALNSLPK